MIWPLLALGFLAAATPPRREEPDREPDPEPLPDPLVQHRVAVVEPGRVHTARDIVVTVDGKSIPVNDWHVGLDHGERPKRPPTPAELAAEDKRRKRAERNARNVAAGGIKAVR
jgi:hypothetical protein